ncbi:MAG TPA: hypothetical protein VK433_09480, partial [Stellaceae bacterium]|nr:hypothetical protein [Stellaceae bacterium]
FGGGRFFDYTAYGDTINIAARLEAANKQLGTRVLASAAAATRAGDFHGRPVGDLALRGRSEPIRVFEPMHRNLEEASDAEAYRKAFALLEASDPGALSAFAAHVAKHSDDPLAAFHLKRLLNGATGTRIALD